MQPTSCLLILTCQSDAIVSTVTEVNVTAALASRNIDVKHLQVFSLIITIDRRYLHRKENLIPVKNNRQLKVWHAVLIAVSVFLLVLVVFALLVFRRKYGSPPKITIRHLTNHSARCLRVCLHLCTSINSDCEKRVYFLYHIWSWNIPS